MAPDLRIEVGFDGSCPHRAAGVRKDADDAFTLFPSWRPSEGVSEEAKGKGSRLGFVVVNDGEAPAWTRLRIDWEDKERKRLKYHDYVFVRRPGETEWTMTAGYIDPAEPVVHFRLALPPGSTEVFLHPRYNYHDKEKFVESLDSPLLEKRLIGASQEGRRLWDLVFTDRSFRWAGKKRLMVMARNHAYESAGSYCVEGMVRWLLSNEPLANFFLARYEFHILPMTNPDGVHNGMSRLTAPQGADLNRLHTAADRAHQVLKETVDEVRPDLLINLHNWMDKIWDGLLCLDVELAEGIQHFMPAEIEYGKRWRVETWNDYVRTHADGVIPKESYSWKDYCMHQFGARGVTFEFPWFGRTTASMRKTGEKALRAVLLAAQS